MKPRSAGERGLSLIEVLVATAILSVAIAVTLTVYDASRKAFAKGENATEQQESVRIAFDMLTSDIRMLGFNVNPDGDPTRPDEQLEGALDHAIVLRGDFDRSDPSASLSPETALAGGAFHAVSTGNDEIVAYVLSNPDGSGPDTITFKADVREPVRDGGVEAVSIPNIVLNPTSPPYTLYRVTLNNDASTYGGSAFIVRTPIVENVRDLSFIYYGIGGTFKDASAAISESAPAKSARSGLARVNVSLVGMTRQQDLNYNDPTDPAAPRNRKFALSGDVTPRNLRFKGIQDLNSDVTPPTKPARPTLTPGHCGGLLVTWAGNPASDGVTQYRVNWGPNTGVVSGSRNLSGSPMFLDQLTTGLTYYVTVQAQDARGNISVKSDPASATVVDLNTPSAPTNFTASTDQTYRVTLTWTPVSTNTNNAPAGDPLAPRIRDLAGYRLYAYGAPVPVSEFPVSSTPPYDLTPLVACESHDYTLTAIDTCGHQSAPTPVARGRAADPGVPPKPPGDVQAQYTGTGTARVKWSPITKDVADNAIQIERYEVYRSAPIDRTSSPSSIVWPSTPTGVADAPPYTYTDSPTPVLLSNEVVYYRINGSDSCGNVSGFSNEALADCTFVGDVEIVTPTNNEIVAGVVPITARVVGGSGSYTVKILVLGVSNGSSQILVPSGSGPSWTANWDALPTGLYTITANVTNLSGCTQSATIEVTRTIPQAR